MPLVFANVVVAAQAFNPSIFSQIWLVHNQIATENEIEPQSVFVPGISQIQTPQFTLFVNAGQLQFAPKIEPREAGELVAQKVGAIVRELPHTPYSAVGINFGWLEIQPTNEMNAKTRRLFFNSRTRAFQEFNVPNARFGAYMSRDFDGVRLKLHMLPIDVPQLDLPPAMAIQFSFNFDKDLQREQDKVARIGEVLAMWPRAFQTSEALMMRILEEAT